MFLLFLMLATVWGQLIIPTIELANGVQMPLGGIGTWLYNETQAYNAVKEAFALGYTHVDTAYDYSNSPGVGRALKESGRPRDSYFVTTKVEGGKTYDETLAEHATNLRLLGLDQVDLLLIHFPNNMSANQIPAPLSKTYRQNQWRALEEIVRKNQARAIGVSHYCKQHMKDILEIASIRPAINQVEFHVGMGSAGPDADDDREWLKSEGIVFQSFSPLCGPCCQGKPKTCTYNKELINGPLVTSIGAKYNKTGVQVSLRWQVQQGIPVIPKTNNPLHMLQNMQIFDFELSGEDMKALSSSSTPPVCGGGDGKTSGDCGLQ